MVVVAVGLAAGRAAGRLAARLTGTAGRGPALIGPSARPMTAFVSAVVVVVGATVVVVGGTTSPEPSV